MNTQPDTPLQQTGRSSRLQSRAATGCGRELGGKVVRQMFRVRVSAARSAMQAAFIGSLLSACTDSAVPALPSPGASTSTTAVITEESLTELAGAYIRGGLWSESLDISAQGTYRRVFWGCMGGSTATSTASKHGSILLLNETRGADEPCADGVRAIDRFVIVPWDQRLYLVPELMILDFCNAVNTGEEPRSQEENSFYFVRMGQCSVPARGRPTLPEQWAPYILPRAVTGVTSAPLEDGTTWVSFGSDEGIMLGMEPVLKQLPTDPEVIAKGAPPFRDQPLEIVEVQGERCRVQYKWARDTRPPIPGGFEVELGRAASGP